MNQKPCFICEKNTFATYGESYPICNDCYDMYPENFLEAYKEKWENKNLIQVCKDLLEYRDNNILNFQLEKADDFLNQIRNIIK